MSKINYHEQTFSLDALDLDPIEKNIIKNTLSGLYGKDTHYTAWKLANAWSVCFMNDGASSLAINEHMDEPGDAWLITRATDESRALHFLYLEDSTGEEWLRGGKVYFFRRKRTND